MLFLVFIGYGQAIYAQLVPDDAKGENSIIFEGGSVGFNISESMLSAQYNSSRHIENGLDCLFGMRVSSTNGGAISNLISDSEIAPNNSVSFILGLNQLLFPKGAGKLYARREQLLEQLWLAEKNFAVALIRALIVPVNAQQGPNFRIVADLLADLLETRKRSKQYSNISFDIDIIAKDNFSPAEYITFVGIRTNVMLNANIANLSLNVTTRSQNLQLAENAFEVAFPTGKKYNQMAFFIGAGATGKSFKKYNAADIVDPTTVFEKVSSTGGYFDVGMNFNHDYRFFIGTILRFQKTDNFSTLEKSVFDLKEKIADNNESIELLKKEEITAYSGNFEDKLGSVNILVDIAYFLNISTKGAISIGPYWRGNNLEPNSKIPTTYDIGLSLNFHELASGKFYGGVYLESKDYNNGLNKFNNEFEDRGVFKTFNFGIRASYVLETIQLVRN